MVESYDGGGGPTAKITSGNFSINAEANVFIDVGHDTMKCARINNGEWTSQLNHFEIQTELLAELKTRQREVVTSNEAERSDVIDSSFKFFQKNIE